MTDTPERTNVFYDAIDAFQRTHRLPGLQHAQLRGLLAEHLARVVPAAPAVVEPPADRAALRDRIAKALDNARHSHPCPVTGSTYWTGCYHPDGTSGSCHTNRRTDAVLAVLPEPANQTALHRIAEAALGAVEAALGDTLVPAARVEALAGIAAVLPAPADRAELDSLGREADRLRKDWVEMRARTERVEAEVQRLRADRAAVLREAADAAPTARIPFVSSTGRECVADWLRRMADETPATQTEPGTCGHRSSEGHPCNEPPGHFGYHRNARQGGNEWTSWVGDTPVIHEADGCGAEPPDGWPGDCWCTLAAGREGPHRCGPCSNRHDAPGWSDEPAAGARQDGEQR